MTGTIFSVEEFSVYDGPGIRTTVFLKGCPLRCTWCHNPEGQRREAEIVRSPNGCLACGSCLRHGEVRDGRTVLTEESIKNCPMHLLRMCGGMMESDALCGRLLKNQRILSASGGGVTFSGGEPFLQSEFLFACLEVLRGKLHTAIQTSGCCREEIFDRALTLADHFLFDLKLADEAAHRRWTGVSNRWILRNFGALAASGKDFTVRIPLIPGVTDTEENLSGIAEILRRHGVHYAELLPYNKLAGGKYSMVMRKYAPGFDETQEPQIREEIFRAAGVGIRVL